MTLLQRFSNWVLRRRYLRLCRNFEKMYETKQEAALAFLSEGANRYFIDCFANGVPLDRITISQHPQEGYLIEGFVKESENV